ncbi:hypothetical protein [Alicyclobacillus acidiphilus]|uniref:hypothetical protein n=1 Tax=Alicyclobacillus acidiphilus TaxID=182455 RepID=UPI000834A401|nr:hypothetical protein [Alicyclobacillus acidiphilus]
MADRNDVTKNLGELLIQDVFAKHRITSEKRRPITPEQKEQLRQLVKSLEEQVQQFLSTQSETTRSN